MKEELLKIAQESLSSDEVSEIVKEKFMNAVGDAIENAFRWGNVKKTIEEKVEEVMIPYIERYDFSEYLPKLDSVLTQKEIKLTDLFKAWIKQCEKDIDTDGLDINYDDGVSYEFVCAGMRFELEDKPSWSYTQRAVIIFENEHDEKLNIEIPVSKWIWDNGKEEPYMLSVYKNLTISSLRNLSEFEVLLLRLSRAGTAIIIDKEYDDDYIQPEKQPEASFS